jgi:hypothetical protein
MPCPGFDTACEVENLFKAVAPHQATSLAALESAVSVKDRRRGRVEFIHFAIQFAQRNVDRSRQMAFAELPRAADVYYHRLISFLYRRAEFFRRHHWQ